MKKIVITGANGLVATELTHLLIHSGIYEIYLVSTNLESIKSKYAEFKNVKCYNIETLPCDLNNSIVIHTAFTRSGNGNDYVSSITFLYKILSWAKKSHIKKFINISSQSVYGNNQKESLWKENVCVNPSYMYALAKAISEQIVENYFVDTSVIWTNLRLSSICEEARFMNVFVKNTLTENDIIIKGANHKFSFIDVRDVATGLLAMIEYDGPFDTIYNLGTGKKYSILDIALIVQQIASDKFGKHVKIIEQNGDEEPQSYGLCPLKFMSTYNWEPHYEMYDMIMSLFLLNTNDFNKLLIPVSFQSKILNNEH